MPNPEPKRALAIQERDRRLLELFLECRFLTLDELVPILAEHFPTRYVLWRRLAALTRAGYLTLPPAQRIYFGTRGNKAHAYALGNKGAAELARLGHELPDNDWNAKAKAIKPSSFEHPLLIARFITCVTLAARKLPDLEVTKILGDGKFRTSVRVLVDGDELELPVRPDATVFLSHDGSPLTLFLEADCETMPLGRTKHEQSSYLKKVLPYLHYWTDEATLSDHGIADFVVLTVTRSASRAAALADVAKRADPEQRGTNVFWFATADEALDLERPERLFTAPVWTTAAGESGALL